MILLLPLGIPLGAFALSLYGKAAQLLFPGSSRFEQLVARGEGALRRHGSRPASACTSRRSGQDFGRMRRIDPAL
jgi:hypothetical protein